ncbi:CCCH-type zinc finger-containing protein [Heterostelium album PN500]|uniref:CCCH-type zinc finger-containing protein n=1 Tax=Heterostelium pallidum (strain ATCC 26659 / Pp 5 / PN500) TaxID=670386 RepID=D3B6E5_HETP5|nr:CCCH-type zinc finger-containing protein [Heterostelium album PN500]EFA82915.1 CCCH-type zinc finger-containing protein [Heterostelium album PN500]|eukprot:XP_020435032.1 CCCH-type zinc finger-containing protein [Heterostelium album PN500]
MPPKGATNKKSLEKEKKQKIEDKTFGLKNKNKSKKVAQFVKNVEQQVNNNVNQKKAANRTDQAKKDKELAEKAKKEMADLLKPTIVQAKVPLGVDPKSIVCEFFKAGQCTKGNKCKFAHDLMVARKDAKIDIYTDRRNADDKAVDSMENWDDDKLKKVIDNKRTNENKNLKTTIVCKYFLEAIEASKYGWFWECPNGGDKCMYQHCLPPGYVLQKKKKKGEEEEVEQIPLEELIEEERAKLTKTTPVTLETFLKWKEEKRIQKEKAAKEAEEKRAADIKAGKTSMSGREMFVYNPDLFIDDEAAIDVKDKEYEEPEEELANNVDKSLFIGEDEDLPDSDDDDEDEDEDEDDEDDDEDDGYQGEEEEDDDE